jgi:hypothetical protein
MQLQLLSAALPRAIAVLATVMLFESHAFAQSSDPVAWVGGLGGFSVPNYENSSSRQIYGISGGAKVGSEFGVGAYFLTSSKDESIGASGANAPLNYDLYGVEFAYHFEGEANGVYIGGRIGTSKLKVNTLVTSPMHYGPVVGYNHSLSRNLSLGGELSWISIAKSSGIPPGESTVQDISAFNTLNFMISAKLWF